MIAKLAGDSTIPLLAGIAIPLEEPYLMVAAPTLQTTSSCEPVPPEHPIAPINLPASTSGIPPRAAMIPSSVTR